MSPLKSLRCYYTLTVTLVLLIILLALLGEPSHLFLRVTENKRICHPNVACPDWRMHDLTPLLQAHTEEEISSQLFNARRSEHILRRKGAFKSVFPFEEDVTESTNDMFAPVSNTPFDQHDASKGDPNPFKAIKKLYLPRKKESWFTSRDLQSKSSESIWGFQTVRPISKPTRAPVLVDDNSHPSTELNSLTRMLTDKLKAVQIDELQLGETCDSKELTANSCDGNDNDYCLRKNLPKDIKTRVSQLVTPHRLQINTTIRNILHEMAQKVVGHYDIILATAASFNHYFESQAMIKNVHENFFPALKNFTFLYYNLGLTPKQRRSLVKNCKCQVLDFPFEKFPVFMSNLSCYSWKPLIIKAHTHQANVLIWADASIRFHANPDDLHAIVDQARKRGIQLGITPSFSPFRSFRNMYHFFGDEPCAYLRMEQAMATMGFFGRDSFVDRAILEPWVGCAVREKCMCALGEFGRQRFYRAKNCVKSDKIARDWQLGNATLLYGLCHRFDQSAISLIVHKLYQGYYRWIMIAATRYVNIRRGHRLTYFPTE